VDFHDRRANAEPDPDDFERPLTKTSITEANKRFRENGVQAVVGKDTGTADKIVRRTTKNRFNGRRKGSEDFASVGEYLAYLNSAAE
jgi:hypothetical protein